MTGPTPRLPFPADPTRSPRDADERNALALYREAKLALINANRDAEDIVARLQLTRETLHMAEQVLARSLGLDAVEMDGVVYRNVAGCITLEHVTCQSS